MREIDILTELEAAGVQFHTPDGEALHVKAPGGLTDELREHIRAHKADIIRAIQAREEAAYGERGWLLVYSVHLNEVVVLARDGQATSSAPKGFTVYTEAEVAKLHGITPDELRQVHRAKSFWGGTVIERQEDMKHDDHD